MSCRGIVRLCPLLAMLSGCVSQPGAISAQSPLQTHRKFEIEDIFNLEYATDPRISPDGRTIVYVRTALNRMTDRMSGQIWQIDTRTGKHRGVITREGSVSAPRWSPSGKSFIYFSEADGKVELRRFDSGSAVSITLATLPEAPSEPRWSPDGTVLAFSMFTPSDPVRLVDPPPKPDGAKWAEPVKVFQNVRFRKRRGGLSRAGAKQIYTLSARGGKPDQLTHGIVDYDEPTWLDSKTLVIAGNQAADAELDPIESNLFLLDLHTATVSPLNLRDGPDSAAAVSADGRWIAYLGYDDELKAYQKENLYIVQRDGSAPQNLTADYEYSISAFAWQGDTIVAQVERAGDIELVRIGLNREITSLQSRVGGNSIARPYVSYGPGSIFSVADTGDIAFLHSDPSRPSEVGFRSRQGAMQILTELNEDALSNIALANIEHIEARSSFDGRHIDAWVALPPGFKADGSYPLILDIHGGPQAMYAPNFAAEIQRYAAEGFVVVYANPRGSTGYGEEFTQLIEQAFPSKDYDDLMSIVDAVVAKNYVDSNRLFVTGGSGGGVLTTWIVGKTNRFKAAAAVKPAVNWLTMALTSDMAATMVRHWMRAPPWSDFENYWRRSPISMIGRVTTPTLLMVGEEDWRTPTWEAEQFYTGLKLQKVDAALIRVPGTTHDIEARPSHLIAKIENILAWFKRHDVARLDSQHS